MSILFQAGRERRFFGHNLMNRVLLAVVISAFPVSVLAVEEFKTPKQIENDSTPVEVKIEADTETAKSLRDQVIDPDSPTLMDRVNAIIIQPRDELVEVPAPAVQGVRISDDNLFKDSLVFKDLLDRYIGESLTISKLDYLVNEIIAHYRQRDYPLVDVVLPEQDITEGVLQLVVIEAKIGKVIVTGNQYFSEDFIVGAMTQAPGDKPHIPSIYKDVNWLSNNPYLRVQPVFGEGEQNGTTDVFLEADDTLPLRVYGTYTDAGNDLIGKHQFSSGLNYGNLWGIGHQINYQFTRARYFSHLKAHAASYKAPLPWRHNLTITGSSTRTEAAQSVLDVSGESDEASIFYGLPLDAIQAYSHNLQVGFDWKRSKNALEFGIVPVLDTTTELAQLNVSYEGAFPYSLGKNEFNITLINSIPGIFDHHNDTAFQTVRADSDASYRIVKLSWRHQLNLPYDMILVNDFRMQYASVNLISNEQFYPTGGNAVRGYDQGLFSSADKGRLVRNELYSPQYSFAEFDDWRFLVFIDHANISAHSGDLSTPTGASDSADVTSAGFGFRLNIKKNISLKADYGFQLNDLNVDGKHERAHVLINAQY